MTVHRVGSPGQGSAHRVLRADPGVLEGRRGSGVCVCWGVRCVSLAAAAGSPVSTASPRAPAFPCGPPQALPERRGRSLPCQPRPGRVYNLPARAPGAAASLVRPPARHPKDSRLARARARIHVALHGTRLHSSPLTLITLAHTRAHTHGSAPPGTRAHTSPLTPHSRPGELALQGRAGTAGESAEGTHGLPMADLSFIEDSVPFPEKEEDEEEEEEGVEWGYEEGNPPRAGRLALPAPPPPLFPTWVPGPFRGSRRSGQSGRRPRASPGARPWCWAAVGTCRRPVGKPEGCVGDSSVWLVARRAALTVTENLENAALLKLLFSFFEKKFFGLQSCVSFRCTAK